jgi:molecular chaperone GrpE
VRLPHRERNVANKEHPTWPDPTASDETGQADVAPGDAEAGEDDALATALAERDDYLDQLQRSRAEFVNFRRRSDQERAQLREFVARDITSQFIPVIDDFERAMTMAPSNPEDAGFVQGVEMIQSKLRSVFDRLGVVKVDALGQPFDPALHEAVATEPGTNGSTVVEVYQNGYRIGDTLVRPAMVKTGDPLETDTSADTVSFNA